MHLQAMLTFNKWIIRQGHIFCVANAESNFLQADVGKLHIIALKLLVPVGEVMLT